MFPLLPHEMIIVLQQQILTLSQVEQDDIIPLSQPIVTVSGSVIDSLPVERGLSIRIPIIGVNRSEALWGPDAARFDPTRWLEERAVDFNNQRKQEIQGYRHLLTFNHGPRICLGRMFVIVEIKVSSSYVVTKKGVECLWVVVGGSFSHCSKVRVRVSMWTRDEA